LIEQLIIEGRMFRLIGLKENIGNVAKLCHSYWELPRTAMSLKTAYQAFLRRAQPNVPIHFEYPIAYLHEKKDINNLLEIFGEKSALDDFDSVFDLSCGGEGSKDIDRVKQGLSELREVDPSFCDLFELAINTIFMAPSKLAGGGSTSGAIGCIWVNIRPTWADQDILEFFVHEGTHNLVFLDELIYQHYRNYADLTLTQNYSWSAILNKPRPLDKVFHSILVSTEVLLFRNDRIGHPDQPRLHPPTKIMLQQTHKSIALIMDSNRIRSLLTDRALYLLDLCRISLQTCECFSADFVTSQSV
jgi:hypothetical protein